MTFPCTKPVLNISWVWCPSKTCQWKSWTFANNKWFLQNRANVSWNQCDLLYVFKSPNYEFMLESYIQMLHYINAAPNPSCGTLAKTKTMNHPLSHFGWIMHDSVSSLAACPHVLAVQLICKHNIDLTIFMKQLLKLRCRVF